MVRVVRVGNINVLRWSQYEIDMIPNVFLGKNGNIMTNPLLRKNKKLSQYINNETMGALDNYAQHEKIIVSIKPLIQDIFDDIGVSVFKKERSSISENFAMKIQDEKEGVPIFFRELYNNVHRAVQKLSKE